MISTIKKSLSFLSLRQRIGFFALAATRAVSSFLDIVGIALIALITGLAANNLNPGQPLQIMGISLPKVSTDTMFALVVGVLIVFALKAAIAISLSKAIAVFLARIDSQKATEVVETIFAGNLSEMKMMSKGDILWAAGGSTSAAFSGLLTNISIFISEGSLLVFIAAAFFVADPVASIFVLIYFAAIVFMIQGIVGRATKRAGVDLAEGTSQSMVALDDTINAYREITITNNKAFFINKFKKPRYRMASSVATTSFLSGMPRYIVETSLMLGVVIFVGFQFLSGQLATGLITIGVFLTGGVRIMAALLPLQSAMVGTKIQVEQSKLALDLLEEARSSNPKTTEKPFEENKPANAASAVDSALGITMNNVSYTYPGSSDPAVDGVSLQICAGQHVALIGPSGAGKTTIVDLMLGLIEPNSGLLAVGNATTNHRHLIEQGLVSYVPQSPGIVSGTIAENVALGYELHEIDIDRVKAALASAHLIDFVESLPDGVFSSVGNQSDALSGGQKQRLGLARALFTNPKLIVLDEATSALDAGSEAFISESIADLGDDVTVVVIAHRLSTVQHSDQVFVVDEGKIVASGTFSHLRETVPMVAEYVKLMSFD